VRFLADGKGLESYVCRHRYEKALFETDTAHTESPFRSERPAKLQVSRERNATRSVIRLPRTDGGWRLPRVSNYGPSQ
jgi:hypothetical protein